MPIDSRLHKLHDSITRKTAITIVAYGDSWTYGSCANGWMEAGEDGDNPDLIHGSWVLQLRRYLQQLNPQAHLHNKGMGGWKSTQGLERFDSIVCPLKPDYLILNFGINDWKGYTSLEDYKLAMESMISRAAELGCETLLWTAGPLAVASGESYGWSEPRDDTDYPHPYEDFLKVLRQLAVARKLLLADAAGEIIALWQGGEDLSLWFGDAIHLNQNGHDLMFNCLQKTLCIV